jgi:hypothetical protein
VIGCCNVLSENVTIFQQLCFFQYRASCTALYHATVLLMIVQYEVARMVKHEPMVEEKHYMQYFRAAWMCHVVFFYCEVEESLFSSLLFIFRSIECTCHQNSIMGWISLPSPTLEMSGGQ